MRPLNLIKPKNIINKLNINKNKEIIAVATLVPAIGAKRTYDEYKSVSDEDKKNLLIRNSAIMLSTLGGAFLGKHFDAKISKKLVELAEDKHFKKMGLTFLQNASIPFFGMVSGFASGQIVEQFVPKVKLDENSNTNVEKQPKGNAISAQGVSLNEEHETNENNKDDLHPHVESVISKTPGVFLQNIVAQKKQGKVFNEITNDYVEQLVNSNSDIVKDFDLGTLGKLYHYAGIGVGGTVDSVYSSLSGFSVGTEPTFKGKLKGFIKGLISGVVVPVGLAVPISSQLNKVFQGKNKVISTLLKASILLPLASFSTKVGDLLADKVNSEIK